MQVFSLRNSVLGTEEISPLFLEKEHLVLLTGLSVGPRVGLDVLEEKKKLLPPQGIELRFLASAAPNLVTLPTTISKVVPVYYETLSIIGPISG